MLSYLAAERTTEIALRIALGAPRQQVLGKVMLDGLEPALLGLGMGLAASLAAARAFASMLYRTRPVDSGVFAAVSSALLTVTVLACLVPAWRASRLDPLRALRAD